MRARARQDKLVMELSTTWSCKPAENMSNTGKTSRILVPVRLAPLAFRTLLHDTMVQASRRLPTLLRAICFTCRYGTRPRRPPCEEAAAEQCGGKARSQMACCDSCSWTHGFRCSLWHGREACANCCRCTDGSWERKQSEQPGANPGPDRHRRPRPRGSCSANGCGFNGSCGITRGTRRSFFAK